MRMWAGTYRAGAGTWGAPPADIYGHGRGFATPGSASGGSGSYAPSSYAPSKQQWPVQPPSPAPAGGGLFDFLEECELEEQRRGVPATPPPQEKFKSAEARPNLEVEALVALVRREVRAEVTAALADFPGTIGSLTAQALPSTEDGRAEEAALDRRQASPRSDGPLQSELAMPSTAASSRCGEACHSPGAPPLKQQEIYDVSALDVQDLARSAEALASLARQTREAQDAQLGEQQREIKGLQETISLQVSHWDRNWKMEAELRAEGDQEVEARLQGHMEARMEARLEALEQQLAQVSASVGSLARLQVELGSEAKVRQEADGRLQAFLKEFRGHIVGEIEEMRAKHQTVSNNVEGVRGLVGRVVELVEMRCPLPASARVAGPDELEGSTPSHQDGGVPIEAGCRTPTRGAASLLNVGVPCDGQALEFSPAVVVDTSGALCN